MKYVQFSKRMVLLVVSAVTCLTGAAMILCYLSAHFPEIVKLVDAYIGFATICFAAYSGNSAVEKYLVRRYHEMRSGRKARSMNMTGTHGRTMPWAEKGGQEWAQTRKRRA